MAMGAPLINSQQTRWFFVEFSRIKGVVIATSIEERTTDGTHYANLRIKDDDGDELDLEHVLVAAQLDTDLKEGSRVDLLCYVKREGRPDITAFAAIVSDNLVIDFGIADSLNVVYKAKLKQQMLYTLICFITVIGIIVSPVFLLGILSVRTTFTSIIPDEMEREEAIVYAQAQVEVGGLSY